MKKYIKYLIVLVATFFFLESSVMATTIIETTKNDDYYTILEGSMIIGATKFDSDVVLTASRVAKAGANDATLYAKKNNGVDGYEAPTIYVYYGVGGWYELDEDNNAIMITDDDLIEALSTQEIYYVNNVEKKIDVSLDGIAINEEKLPDGVLLQDDKLLVNATLDFFTVYTTNNAIINGYLTEENYDFILQFIYSIDFNSNGGTEIPSQTSSGNKVKEPNPPLKDGYKFDGWYLNNELFDFNSTINDNITLEAKWIPITYNIEYNLDGGIFGEKHPENAEFDEVIEISTPTKGGYKFNGWYYYGGTGTGYYGDSLDNVTSSFNGYSNDTNRKNVIYFKNLVSIEDDTITLTASWEPIKYKLIVKMNGADMPNSPILSDGVNEVRFNTAIKIENPKMTGYTFEGWQVTSGLNPETAKYGDSYGNITNKITDSSLRIKDEYFTSLTNIDGGEVVLEAIWSEE